MIPIIQNIKRYFSLKELAIVLLAVVVSVSVGITVFVNLKKDVVIDDNSKQIHVRTMKTTVREVLEQNGVSVKNYDYVSLPLDSKLQKMKTNNVVIERAVPIYVQVNGKDQKIMTYKDTVKEALQAEKLLVSDKDRIVGADFSDSISADMRFKLIKVEEKLLSENVPVPFATLRKENTRLDANKENVLVQGKNGLKENSFKITFEDGLEVARQLLSEVIISNPIDMITEFGTIMNHKTARGDVIRYSKVLDMRATAYTASYQDTGKHPDDPLFGITASGLRVRKGLIAVDPRVIPLGTKVYVEVAGNTPDYGFAIAADTGGAIKNDLIDLYYDEQEFVNHWGVKKVKLYILND